jgi:sugar-specific transcriptional regulator TrmB
MDDRSAVDGLTRLGLTTYEARVFIALQKLGSGTASDVSDISEVPRSQVYGAAEGLEERGLVETKRSRPTVYRPIEPAAARQRLLDQLADAGAEAFEYLEAVRGSVDDRERSEDIWLVHGADAVVSRATELIADSREQVVYAADTPEMVEQVSEPLAAAAAAGADVVVASADPAVRAAAADRFETVAVPSDRRPDIGTGRVVVVDGDAILLSVFSTAGEGEGTQEIAFWSRESAFAAVLVEFFEEMFLVESTA